jgi:hypothetical protein
LTGGGPCGGLGNVWSGVGKSANVNDVYIS